MDLFSSRRLLLICGKGGVGKTTVASAIALSLARKGEKVLLVGIHSTDQFRCYFGVSTVGLKEVKLEPRLFAIHLDEQEVFDRFIRQTFRIKAVYRRILESPIYQYFIAAVPGFKELMVLHTIQRFATRKRGGYDRILIDCPPTGHGVSYFDVGNQAMRTFPIGALRRKAEAVQELLTSAGCTGVVLVTLAEEMPVNETIELYSATQERLQITVEALVVNALLGGDDALPSREALTRLRDGAPFFSHPDLARCFATAGLFYEARTQINRQHLERLRKELPLPRLEIPFLSNEARDLAFLEEVSGYLGEDNVRR